MNKEKISSNETQGNYHQNEIPKIQSSEIDVYSTEILKKLYLPSAVADQSPSEESIERANGLNSSKPDTLV